MNMSDHHSHGRRPTTSPAKTEREALAVWTHLQTQRHLQGDAVNWVSLQGGPLPVAAEGEAVSREI